MYLHIAKRCCSSAQNQYYSGPSQIQPPLIRTPRKSEWVNFNLKIFFIKNVLKFFKILAINMFLKRFEVEDMTEGKRKHVSLSVGEKLTVLKKIAAGAA